MRLALSDSESDSGSESSVSRASSSKPSSRGSRRRSYVREDGSDSGEGSSEDELPPVNRLHDDDDESEDEVFSSDTEASLPAKHASAQPVNSSPSPSPEPEPQVVHHARQSLAVLSGQDQRRNKVMQASLFQPRAQQTPQLQLQASPAPLSKGLPAPSNAPRPLLLESAQQPDVVAAPKLPGRAPRAPKRSQHVAQDESVLDVSSADPALRLARSFGASWGPDGRLAGPSKEMLAKPSTLRLSSTAAVDNKSQDDLDALLSVQLAHTTFVADDHGIPRATPLPTLRFSHFQTANVHRNVFSLGHTLFDPIGLTDLPQDATQVEAISRHARRAALLEWWTEATSDAVESALKNAASQLEGTLVLLTGNQIARAADSAIDQHDFRLATLIAQAGTADLNYKTDLHNQLSTWQQLDLSKHVDKTYRDVLALLAGQEPSTSLDWQRQLACTLFYHSHDLAAALNSYQPTDQEDFSYELTRLFCRLSPALEHSLLPAHFPGSSDVEREAQAFIAYQLLAKVHRFADFEESESSACQLIVNLAAGLEQAGLWHWAIFVLLHLTSSESRQITVKQVLCRHAALFSPQTLSALESFAVPLAWVAEAQARLAMSEDDRFEAAQFFFAADLLSDAHELIVCDLAPEAVLAQDLDLLERMLQPFLGHELHVAWSEGGQLYQTYLSAMRLQDGLKQGRTAEISRLRSELPRILALLPGFLLQNGDKERSLTKEAAVSQMLSDCTRVWQAIDPTLSGDTGVEATRLVDPVHYVASLASAGFKQALAQAGA